MVNKKGKGAKAKGSKPPVKKPQQSPQERVALVRPYWETLEQDERVKLLSLELDSVRARATHLVEAARQQAVADAPQEEPLDPSLLELEPSIEDVLEEGIKRLKEKGTWKLWQWPPDNAAMYDAESFRQHISDKNIREELRRLLPRDEGRATEKPAEAAFRQRMLDLMAKVQQSTNANSLRPTVAASGEEGAARPYRRRGDPGSHLRDANIELLAVLLEALAKENDNLYHSLLTPITTYVMEILQEGQRETTKQELSFEDLENIMPDEVARIVEWLTEKVDALSTKLKPEPKDDEEEEEENMGDVDLWSLAEENTQLTVNAKWLQHLQDRLLGEDGHPRRAKACEDPGHHGLVLEWVYGSIVSTAEKARDGSKRPLGMQPPTAADAHLVLVRALEEHLAWETRAKQCKDLLSEMLKSRLEAAELTKQGYDLRPLPKRDLPGVGGSEVGASSTSPLLLEDSASGLGLGGSGDSKPLPDEVILFMLRREALLTRGKLHFLVFEHLTQEKDLRILKQALRQGEPEFERLKRELDEVKHQPRGMEGAYRSAAEMDRHRHQLEVQTAFREQGARLQATYEKKQKAEYDMAKRETEIKQLQGWKGTVENLVDKFQELINARNERLLAASGGADGAAAKEGHEAEGDLEAASGSLTPQQYIQLTKMRNHFAKDVRKQLYGDADDRTFFDNLKTALKAIERRLEDSSVALQHLEMQLINVACDDPGAIIGTQLALPLLQERLDQRGLEYAAKRAKLAEDEVLRMELLSAEREAAERERKKAAKAKKNEKAKSEKERLAAEKLAKEEAERAARLEAERERAVRDEEERRKRLEAREAIRKAEEAAMELRRKELLSDENGYWRQRMIMEERLSGMAVGTAGSGNAGRHTGSEDVPGADVSEEQERPGSSSPEDVRQTGNDDEGFVTENRRRRHKDTRDQDEEVAAPAPPAAAAAAAGASAPGAVLSGANSFRSGSRDRMPPRDGAPPRERGEIHSRGRDREPRRHHGSVDTLASGHRSGSREAAGRQGPHTAGRPPSAPHAPLPPPPVAAAASPPPSAVPEASPPAMLLTAAFSPVAAIPGPVFSDSAEPERSLAPTAPAPVLSVEASEQPAAPATVSPSRTASQDASVVAGSTGDVVSLPAAAVASAMPEEAILFGDIAVIPSAISSSSTATAPPIPMLVPVPVPIPVPVPVIAVSPTAADSQAEPSGTELQPGVAAPATPRPPQPGVLVAPSTSVSQHEAQHLQQQQQQLQQQQQRQPGPAGAVPVSQQPLPQGQAPIGAPMPPALGVHPMGHHPPGPMHGSMPPMVAGPPPAAMMHMGPQVGPGGQVGAPRPPGPGPAPGPPPPYVHVNGGMTMPLPTPGGPMPPMGAVMPKQMPGQQMPPPPPAAILMPMGGPPPGARSSMQGPGMAGPPPPQHGQPGMQVPPLPQQPGPMVRPGGPPMVQQGPMPGMPGQGPHGGLVPVPHPQGPGQPPHGQPPGPAPRGGPGQPMLMPPMQFPNPMHGNPMTMSHGQPPSGPMGHVPPGVYVFPPGGPGMVPPGAPGQLPPNPHVQYVMPGGVGMPLGGPPAMHMQPPVPPQQQPQQQPASCQAAPQMPSGGVQPPPPPKSPSAAGTGGSKPLNANARSFVPSGKAGGGLPGGGTAAGQAAGQQQQTSQQQSQQQQQSHAGVQAAGPSAQQGQRQQYQRQSSGGVGDGSASMTQVQQLGPQQPGASFQRGIPSGPYGGQGGQQQGPGAVPYGNRRDRRDLPRGGGGSGGAGGRKGQGMGQGPATHGVILAHGDMQGVPPMAPPPPHAHAHPHGPPHPMPWMGAPMLGAVPVPPPPVQHGPGMEPVDGVKGAAEPLDRPTQDGSNGSAGPDDSPSRLVPAPDAGPGVLVPPHQQPPPPGVVAMGHHPGHPHAHAPGPGPQNVMMPPPPHPMAPPPGHATSRVMLVMQPGMPGPITVPMHMPMPMQPMVPVHLMHPGAAGPAPGLKDGPTQKNGSAAESMRAAHQAQQPADASASAEAEGEGAQGGRDSAAAASAKARMSASNHGDKAAAAPAEMREQEGGVQATSGSQLNNSSSSAGEGPAASALSSSSQRSQEAAAGGALPTRPLGQPAEAAAPSTSSSAVAATDSRRTLQPGRTSTLTPTHGSSQPASSSSRSSGRGTAQQPAAPVSWSSVAATRRDGSASSGAPTSNGFFPEAFPSLAGPASSPASATTSEPQPTAHPLPAAASSWKAKLQQNVATQQQQQQQPPTANGGSPSTANGVRGSSPRGTLSGSVQLASSLSDSAMSHGSAAGGVLASALLVPRRPAGNRPTGPALLSGAPTQLAGSLTLHPSSAGSAGGIVYHPGVSGQPRCLQLVRGLQNLGGQHNCFLNVTIQSLWHLHSFREALLHVDVDAVATRGAAQPDVAVLRALVDVFKTMATPTTASSGTTANSSPGSHLGSWVVSPLALREALSLLETGQAAVRLDLSEMHDAFEVLLVLLTCMHRAEAGSGASQGQDPQLPRRMRVRDIAARKAGSKATSAAALPNGHHANGPAAAPAVPPPTGYAAVVAAGGQQPQRGKAGGTLGEGAGTAVPRTAAHSLFGIEVQVPCATEDEGDRVQQQQRGRRDSSGGTGLGAAGADGGAGATPGGPGTALALVPRQASASGRAEAGDFSSAEVEVYTKYFHLVHAQALRNAFAALDGANSGAYFEDVLCAAEATGTAAGGQVLGVANGGGAGRRATLANSGLAAAAAAAAANSLTNGGGHAAASAWSPGATAAAHPLATLLRYPTVFTLALVWESPQAPMDALRGTLEAIGPRLDLALLFRCPRGLVAGEPPATTSAPCEMRSVICYFGHHYLVFALSEELGLWLLIDDANIQLVGHWGDVVKTMCTKRLQPSLLFYEALRAT